MLQQAQEAKKTKTVCYYFSVSKTNKKIICLFKLHTRLKRFVATCDLCF